MSEEFHEVKLRGITRVLINPTQQQILEIRMGMRGRMPNWIEMRATGIYHTKAEAPTLQYDGEDGMEWIPKYLEFYRSYMESGESGDIPAFIAKFPHLAWALGVHIDPDPNLMNTLQARILADAPAEGVFSDPEDLPKAIAYEKIFYNVRGKLTDHQYLWDHIFMTWANAPSETRKFENALKLIAYFQGLDAIEAVMNNIPGDSDPICSTIVGMTKAIIAAECNDMDELGEIVKRFSIPHA